jgi:hypothetical protein
MFYIAFKNAILIFLIVLILHFFLKNNIKDNFALQDVVEIEEEEEPVPQENLDDDEDMLFNFVNSESTRKEEEETLHNSRLGTFSSANFAMYSPLT